MAESLFIPDEEPPKPVTTFRVLVISALVAFVIGCVPALTTALVVNSNLNDRSRNRSIENCQLLNAARAQNNARSLQNRENLKADVKLYETVLKLTPTKAPPGSPPGQQHKLDVYNKAIREALQTKRDKVLPLTQPLLLRDCNQIFPR